MNPHDTDWLSLHIYLSGVPETEAFMEEQLAPRLRGWTASALLDSWFFIRYWEGGPHIRVRLAGPIAADAEAVRAELAQATRDYLIADPVTREVYYRAHSFDGQPVDHEALPWHEQGSVVQVPYEAEIQRYGGIEALGASERLFGLSSSIAMSVVKATRHDMAKRASLSFGLMAASILATRVSLNAMGQFFRHYAAFWASYHGAPVAPAGAGVAATPGQVEALQRLVRQVSRGAEALDLHSRWARGVAEFVDELDQLRGAGVLVSPFDGKPAVDEQRYGMAVQNILSSQIHMLNNRLGIVPASEQVLAAALQRAAEAAARTNTVETGVLVS
jgi:hypothetical protein